jgi:hypothetical protein
MDNLSIKKVRENEHCHCVVCGAINYKSNLPYSGEFREDMFVLRIGYAEFPVCGNCLNNVAECANGFMSEGGECE